MVVNPDEGHGAAVEEQGERVLPPVQLLAGGLPKVQDLLVDLYG